MINYVINLIVCLTCSASGALLYHLWRKDRDKHTIFIHTDDVPAEMRKKFIQYISQVIVEAADRLEKELNAPEEESNEEGHNCGDCGVEHCPGLMGVKDCSMWTPREGGDQ